MRRGEEQLALNLTLAAKPFQPGTEVGNLVPGLRYRFFHGEFTEVPVFSRMKPVREGTVESVDLKRLREDRDIDFGIELSGYLRIPEDGIYRLIVVSDDGSILYIDGELAVDNDGSHPPQPMSRLLRLGKGLHVLRLDYFQGESGKTLELLIESDGKRQRVKADSLFHSAPSAE